MAVILQLFYRVHSGSVAIILIKHVDDLLTNGEAAYTETFLRSFNSTFELGTVVCGPGTIKLFGMFIIQSGDYSPSIDADEKLRTVKTFPLSRVRPRQWDLPLTAIEKFSFMFVNSLIEWLETAATPFCVFYASHLQQKIPDATMAALCSQTSYLRLLK